MSTTSAGAALWTPSAGSSDASGDQQLLERFVAQRDDSAFARLVERHGRLVWNVCRRFLPREQDAEDAFQAVFLVFARKAHSIRKGEAVGSWLYGVAYRLALRTKQTAVKRQLRDQQAPQKPASESPVGEAAARELQRILDEEVMRLKDKYRQAFVLCTLEGMSKAEAAKELGANEGTISSRLARARSILQSRLAKRGFTLSAALTAVALAHHSAWAATPAALAQTTAGAVLATEAGAAGQVSQSALSLADGFLRRARLATLASTLAILVLLFLSLGGAAVGAMSWISRHPANEPVVTLEPDTFLPPGTPLGTPVDERVLTVAFCPEGRRFVTAGAWGGMPGQLKIWNAATGKEGAALTRIPGIRSASYSPDGKTLVTGDFSGALTWRDPDTGEERASIKAHPGGVQGVAFSADSDLLATSGLDGKVKLWRTRELRESKVFVGHTDKVLGLAFFRNGKAIITAGQDRTAKIWELETGKEMHTLRGHRAAVEAVAVSPDDKLVATASSDQTVRLWDAETGEEKGTLSPDERQEYLTVAFSPDGAYLVAAGRGATIHVWDTRTKELVAVLEKHKAPIWALAFAPDGTLASGSADRTAKFWTIKGGKSTRTFETSWSAARPIRAAAYSPDGKVVAVATVDKDVFLRDAKTGDVIQTLRGHGAPINALAFSRNGKILASGSDDASIKLWDVAAGEELRTLDGHAGAVHALLFNADDATLFSAGDDKLVRHWDVASGKPRGDWKGHDAPIHALAISPDNKTLASGGADRRIQVWDVAAELPTHVLKGHSGAIRALAFPSDGALASGGDDKTIKLWDVVKGVERRTIDDLNTTVRALAFTPKGSALVAAGQDGAVRVWDPSTGQSRGVLQGHKDEVTALAMHPHGHNLVSGSLDTVLRRWQPGKLKGEIAAVPNAAAPIRAPLVLDFVDAQGGVGKDAPPGVLVPKGEVDPRVPVGKEFQRIFKGKPDDMKGLALAGQRAKELVSCEEAGLRITAPVGYPKDVGLGVMTRLIVRGDFEIAMSFEILAEPDAAKAGAPNGTRLCVIAGFEREGYYSAKVMRGGRTPEGSIFAGASRTKVPRFDTKRLETTAKAGRMKLVRKGDTLFFYKAESLEEDYALFHECPFVTDDLENVRFIALSGNPGVLFDVRILDLSVRADALLLGPTSPTTRIGVDFTQPVPFPGRLPTKEGEAGPRVAFIDNGEVRFAPVNAAPLTPSPQPERSVSKGWLFAALIVGMVITLAFLCAFAVWLFARQRRRAAPSPAAPSPAAASAASEAIAFACPECGAKLKVRAELAGKRVKCRKCATGVQVPEPEEDIPVV